MKKTVRTQKNIFGYDGSYVTFMSNAFDVLGLGFLWFLCSIPVFTIGASTSALYYAVVKSVKKNNGYAAAEFFHAFRQNFKQSTILWLLQMGIMSLLIFNIKFLMQNAHSSLSLFFIVFYAIVLIFSAAVSIYIFTAVSRFDMRTIWFLKLAPYMSVRYFGTTLILLLIFASSAALIYRIPFLIVILPGPVTFLISEFMERVLAKHSARS